MSIKHTIIAYALGFGILALLLVVFLLYPTAQDIKTQTSEALKKRDEVLLLDIENKKLNIFEENYESYKSDLQKVSQLFVDAQNPVAFIEFLENAAAIAKVDIEVAIIGPSQQAKAATFRIMCRGDFSSIVNFFDKLETGPYLLTIRNAIIQDTELQEETANNSADALFSQFLIEVATK